MIIRHFILRLGFLETDNMTRALFIALKDHDNDTVLMSFVKSQVRVIKRESSKEGIDLRAVSLTEGTTYSTHTLTTLWLTKKMDSTIASELRESLIKVRQWVSVKLVDDSLAGNLH